MQNSKGRLTGIYQTLEVEALLVITKSIISNSSQIHNAASKFRNTCEEPNRDWNDHWKRKKGGCKSTAKQVKGNPPRIFQLGVDLGINKSVSQFPWGWWTEVGVWGHPCLQIALRKTEFLLTNFVRKGDQFSMLVETLHICWVGELSQHSF